MLYDPARHEPLRSEAWDADRTRAAIAHVIADAEAQYRPGAGWPTHPLDIEPEDEPGTPFPTLYLGTAGVAWALHYLQSVGAARLVRGYADDPESLRLRNRAWLESFDRHDHASYLSGDTPILMLAQGLQPTAERAQQLASLIAGNIDHPARELMLGAPGTLLAALFLYERDPADARWAELFRRTAARLWTQLEWSPKYECHCWTQDLFDRRSTYIDAVHGFVATALPLIRGRHLLSDDDWAAWQACITNTVQRTATRDGPLANWQAWLEIGEDDPPPPLLMQYCHGAPGFVVCLAGMPGPALDGLLLAAGEAVWAAGPLVKGSNLCHGTGGNGYAFLKLYRRSGDPRWLERARAFAMHGIAQMQADAARYGRMRYSLWTGDLGFAIYLWDCLRGDAAFPTLDVFYA